MVTHSKHSFFPGLENGGVIYREMRLNQNFFPIEQQVMTSLYQSTWREFALAVLEGLEQVKQPVVIETDFTEYVDDDGMQVLHFEARYIPVKVREVTMLRSPKMDHWQPQPVVMEPVIEPMNFIRRLKFLVTGKV